MNDFSLGYVLDGRHFGTGIGIGKLPEAFAVREHMEDGGYVETLYLPELTCHMKPIQSEPDATGYLTHECDVCGWEADYPDDCPPTGWCAGCGSRVVES